MGTGRRRPGNGYELPVRATPPFRFGLGVEMGLGFGLIWFGVERAMTPLFRGQVWGVTSLRRL